MNLETPIMTAGECICCPMCGKPIGFATEDIFRGTRITARMFTAIPPQKQFVSGQQTLTTCCKEPYMAYDRKRGPMVFTKRGWV